MALPFQKIHRQAGISVDYRKPDEDKESPQESGDEGLMAAAQDLMDSVRADNIKGVAAALKAAFDILDSEPHEEGPHIEPNEEE